MKQPFDIVIVGAGMSGICMAIKLKEAGIHHFVILEKSKGVGGTWHENTYPGAACDVPSHLYSFSFEPNPHWSRIYSPQPEIKAYFEHCVNKYAIKPHIKLEASVEKASFDAEQGLWSIHTKTGEAISAKNFIIALGQLNRPMIPNIAGIESFQGKKIHSAQWDHSFDMQDKNIAVIGNAASAIQLIPEVVKQAKKLTIFQRTPNYIIPRNDRDYTQTEKTYFARYPFLMKLIRGYYYLFNDLVLWPGLYKSGWFRRWNSTKAFISKMKKQITDPLLQKKLTPDYTIGCKRILISDNYYSALTRSNVEIVTHGIDKITVAGLLDKKGIEHKVDAIIFATGFETESFVEGIDVQGKNGQTLAETWKNGAEAYFGITVPNFPNLFMLYGPNTNLGHNSIIFMSEIQVDYIIKCIKQLKKLNGKYIQPKPHVVEKFNAQLQTDLKNTIWISNCNSWYKNSHGKITTNWSHSTIAYQKLMRNLDFDNFEIV